MKKTKVLTGAILLAALAGVLYFLFYYSRALDTRDYISVSFQGVNGNLFDDLSHNYSVGT